MEICISSYGPTLDSRVQQIFGRCSYFIFVDPKSMECEAVPNPNASSSYDAGIQSAKLVADRGVSAVLSGCVGAAAEPILDAADVEIMFVGRGTVREAMEAFINLSSDLDSRGKRGCFEEGPMRFRKCRVRKGREERANNRN